jgi:hypothetical protein
MVSIPESHLDLVTSSPVVSLATMGMTAIRRLRRPGSCLTTG